MYKEKSEQLWKIISNPGKRNLVLVQMYGRGVKVRNLVGLSFIALAVGYLVTTISAKGISEGAGFLIQKTVSLVTAKNREKTPAQPMTELRPIFSAAQFDINILPDLIKDVQPEMLVQIEKMKKGEKFSDCNFNAKITENWFDGIDATPKCRYSKDQTRLWVWSIVRKGEGYGPFFGIVSKRDGAVDYLNIDDRRIQKLPNYKSLSLELIPRTVALDFPELLIK